MGPNMGPIWAPRGPKKYPNRRFRLIWTVPFSASMLDGLVGPIWERFRTPLGGLWGLSWALLGPTWGHLWPSWAILGPSWDHLGAVLGHLGAVLGHLGAILGPSWPSWVHIGAMASIDPQRGPAE